MDKIKSDCMVCKYGGCHNIVENWFRCDCEDNPDRIEVEDEFSKFAVKNPKEYCEHFIPVVDINSEDIIIGYSYNVPHECPHCGHKDVHYAEHAEGEEIITCESCCNKYEITWDLF